MLILEHDMKLKAHLTKRMRDAHWCRFKENLEDLGMRISSSICEADMVTHFLKTRRGVDTHLTKRMRDAHWCRFKENLEDLGMRISSSICEADMVTHFLKTRRGVDTHVAK